MDCSLPGSSVHEIFQAKILEWVDTPFSGNLQPRNQTHISSPVSLTLQADSLLLSNWGNPWDLFNNLHFNRKGHSPFPGATEVRSSSDTVQGLPLSFVCNMLSKTEPVSYQVFIANVLFPSTRNHWENKRENNAFPYLTGKR